MSKEMLPRKLTGDQSLAAEPSIVIETNKDKKRRGSMMFLLAVAVGVVALTSITLLAPVIFYYDIKSSSSIGNSGYGAAIPTDMAASLRATDAKGYVIDNNGVTRSEHISISGYSDSRYNTKLRCYIDELPIYCDGSPVVISGFPFGEHRFTIKQPSSSGETTVHAFSWTNTHPGNR
jgi:hypothetical protein